MEKKEIIEGLLQYLLNQKRLADELAEEYRWKADQAERKGDEGKAHCRRRLLGMRETEIENLKRYIDLVQELHYEETK